jgi:hypothetical protein
MVGNVLQVGSVNLEKAEIERLANGDDFLTLVRQVEGSGCPLGQQGDIYWAREQDGKKTNYALKVISALMFRDKWFIVMNKMDLTHSAVNPSTYRIQGSK